MAREKTYRVEAVVLRRSDFGEADRLLTLFSREKGKIRAIAKGARKPQSRKTGHVELFMRTQFLIAEGRDLDIVTQAELVEAFVGVREDLIRATYAAYFVELLDRFTAEEDQNVALYDLLVETLRRLGNAPEPILVARHGELRLLAFSGYRPQFFNCVVCEEEIAEQDQFFSAELGGMLCPGCAERDRRARPISAGAVKVLRYLQTRDWQTVQSLRLRGPMQAELENTMHFYLTYILERDLKSVEFLHRLRREAALFTTHNE